MNMIIREGARRVDTCPPCSQACNQGRSCVTRQACELPEDDEHTDRTVENIVIAAICVMALIAAVAPALV